LTQIVAALALLMLGAAPQSGAPAAQLRAPAWSAPACGTFDEFLQRVSAAGGAAKSAVVDEYLNCLKAQETPLLEKGTKAGFGRAIYLYRGPASLVALAGEMNGWTPDEAFTPVQGTNLFFLAREYELDARLEYRLVLNDKNWILDPMNSRRSGSSLAPVSFFTMPEYALPAELQPGPSLRHGAIESFSFASRILNNERAVKIYLPPDYNGSRERFKTLYVLDGADYLNIAEINEILDTMIQRSEIPPVIAVLIPPLEGVKEFSASGEFAQAIATELVPAIEAKFRTRNDAASRAVLGNSLGAVVALTVVGQFPQVFANGAGQSCAVTADTDFSKIAAASSDAARVHLDVGTYETDVMKQDLLMGNRRLRDFLQSHGFAVQYREVHEGHDWSNWAARVPEAIVYFWGLPRKKK
jgi:enterochelin esterase-like enzyme